MSKKNKKEINEITVVEPKTVKTKTFTMLANVGTNPDGSVKRPKGSEQSLTKEQETNYKLNKLI